LRTSVVGTGWSVKPLGRDDDVAANRDRVGGVRLGDGDADDVGVERGRRDRLVGEQDRVLTERRDDALEVQHVRRQPHGDDPHAREHLGEPRDAGGVRTTRLADVDRVADAHDISAVERRVPRHARDLDVRRERSGDRRGLAAPRRSARLGDQRDIIDDHRRVLDEAAVCMCVVGGESLHARACRGERVDVRRVLEPGELDVDRRGRRLRAERLRERRRDVAYERAHHACGVLPIDHRTPILSRSWP